MPPYSPKVLKTEKAEDNSESVTNNIPMYPTSFIQEESQIHKDDLTDTLFIGMSNGESIILSGSYYFEVLKGTCIVLNYQCSSNGIIYHVDSPVSDSAIVIKATSIPSKFKPKQLTTEYPIHDQSKDIVEEYIHLYDCVIAIFSEKERKIQEIEKTEIKPKATFTQDDDLLIDLDLENAIPESQYIIKTAKLITSFEPVFPSLIPKQTHQGQIEYDNQWQQSFEDIAKAGVSVTMVIGSSNVGKSMYCRVLINQLLNIVPKVVFLDIDVGQCEYTTEGVMSLTVLESPQFRASTVPCIHDNSFRVFYGDKTPESNPIKYYECIQYLLHYYQTVYSEYPLVINTCGWIKGVGAKSINLIFDSLFCHHVVFIQKAAALEECPIPYIKNSKLITLFSPVPEKKSKSSVNVREKRLTHYFIGNQMIERMIGDAILQLPRYSIPISHFQCYLGNIDPHYYYIALSGILVGLSVDPSFIPSQQPEDSGIIDECYLPAVRYYPKLLSFTPVCQNLGIGIVHSVDLKKNVVTILTPLETEQMKEVNTLIRSTEPIPYPFLQNSLSLHIPFYTSNIRGIGSSANKARPNLKRVFSSYSCFLSTNIIML